MPVGRTAKQRAWDVVMSLECDKDLKGWYRFNSPGETELASDCQENDGKNVTTLLAQPCGATFRGYLLGRHPTLAEGRVQRRVCFAYNKRCRCEFSTKIAVRNCDGFFVYRLNPTPVCDARYCSAPKGKTSEGTLVFILVLVIV